MSNLPRKQQNHNINLVLKTQSFDVSKVRRYLAGLESMAREARTSGDPRVIGDALKLIALQPANVRELLIQV
jgi:hypothetical protein